MANYVGSKFGQADHEKLVSFRPLSWRVINFQTRNVVRALAAERASVIVL